MARYTVCNFGDVIARRSEEYIMGVSKKRSPSGLLSEAGKKSVRAAGDAAKRAVGKKPAARAKSPGGNLSEAAKKAGRGVTDAARKAVGLRPTRIQKSGSE